LAEAMNAEQKKANRRLGLILVSVAVVFFCWLHGQDDFVGPLIS